MAKYLEWAKPGRRNECVHGCAVAVSCPQCARDHREELGKLVRQVWVGYCIEIGDDKPSHIAPWEELSEPDKEADRRIGQAIYDYAQQQFLDKISARY